MSNQYEITGLGPMNTVTGLQKIFTRLPKPFEVNEAWLTAQRKAPAVGDVIESTDAGAVSLVTEAQAAVDAAKEEADANDVEKKSLGSDASANGSKPSHFSSYKGKPIIVHASEIKAVGEPESDGSRVITLTGGGEKIAASGMMSRMIPTIGDYWVMVPQDDGFYEYLNPKAVFEAKYDMI